MDKVVSNYQPNALFFISFLIISVLLMHNVITASIYTGFVNEMTVAMHKHAQNRYELQMRIQCLDIGNRGS